MLINNETYDNTDYPRYKTKNTSVYDETGNLVGTLTSGDNYVQVYNSPNGKRYLVTEEETDSEEYDLLNGYYNEYVIYFWDFSGESGVAVPMATGTRTSRAYPNPLHQGRDFTIELSETASEGTRVVVADMNGAVIYSRPVKAGVEKIMIPARELRYGNMVYSVICGDELLEKGKILVR